MSEIKDELTIRKEQRDQFAKDGIQTYPSTSNRTTTISNLLNTFDNLETSQDEVTIAGRIIAIRSHGGSMFMPLNDGTGQIQLFLKKDNIGEEGFEFAEKFDIGDFIEATGKAMVTKRGEKSVLVSATPRILTKALRPLPEKWHGLSDPELKVRKRYLDFLTNDESRQRAIMRSKIAQSVRQFYLDRGYMEVETPMLQTIPGGATARPFKTHLNALDLDMYLRVAPELYLKRLVVAGFPKVFEMARCFRNEGIDHSHNPEFTQVESYEAYANYKDYMNLVEELLRFLVKEIYNSETFEYNGLTINVGKQFQVKDWVDTLSDKLGANIDELSDQALKEKILAQNVKLDEHEGRGSMLDTCYKQLVRPFVEQPTFFINLPTALSPLAKPLVSNNLRAERFSLVLGKGIELVNGYSELNDPELQRTRFEEQEALREAGDDEAQRIDEDYIEALEYGMPPTAGLGIGIDRLTALLTNSQSLKEVILFPTVKPKHEDAE